MAEDGSTVPYEPEPTYARYAEHVRPGIRGVLRGAALSTLAVGARLGGQLDRHLRRPRVQLIYLHHVFRDEQVAFRRLLADLARHHTFIGHSEAVERVRSGRIDRPYVSVSFDDGFADNLAAASILEEFDATGCFFVCPSIVGESDPARLAAFCAQRLHFPLVTAFMGWADLERLLARGHEIGAHTMTHPNLGETSDDVAEAEIVGSREALVRRLGDVRHFAWPRGQWRHFSTAARAAVFRAGFDSCSSAVRGCHVARASGPPSSLCVRRDHVVANWPLDHIRFLLMRDSATATAASNDWPATYPPLA